MITRTDVKLNQEDKSQSMVEENPPIGSQGITKEGIREEERVLINWIKKIRFQKKLFGGVDEQDVWKKIEELNRLYEEALKAERIRYDVLLNEIIHKREVSSPHTKVMGKGNTTDE